MSLGKAVIVMKVGLVQLVILNWSVREVVVGMEIVIRDLAVVRKVGKVKLAKRQWNALMTVHRTENVTSASVCANLVGKALIVASTLSA
jgi:hypothetical protein